MEKHLELLGFKVRDVITGFEGVVVSISFDVSGCVQGLVQPERNKDGKFESYWFDTKRLRAQGKRVTAAPTFERIPGGNELPAFAEKPVK
jgi:hypothetical protein